MSSSLPPTRLLAAAVVAIGATLAACVGTGGEPPAPPPGADVVIVGNDGLRYEPDVVEIAAGDRLGLVCEGNLPHNVVIVTAASDVEVVECGGREAADGVVDVPPGDYDFVCTIPGHESAGMVGTITVQ